MKRTIKTLRRKTVTTKFGEMDKWLITFEESPSVIVDSFIGNWNQNWRVGSTIEFDKSQIKVREWEGKKYYTLQAPPEARFRGVSRDEFDALVARVEKLEEANRASKDVEENELPPDDEFPPNEEEEELDLSSIPF